MQPTDFILVNNLAFALLRRMASDLFVYKAADNAKANDKAKGDANAKRQVEGVSSIWELICRRDLAPDGTVFHLNSPRVSTHQADHSVIASVHSCFSPFFICSCACSLFHLLAHSLAHSLTHSLAHTFTNA